MSFTAEVRDELAEVNPQCPQCNKAELAALVRLEGTLAMGSGTPRLEISTDIAGVARRFITLTKELYGLTTELTVRRSVLHKSRNYLVTVPYQAGFMDALTELGILGGDGIEMGIRPELVERDCCAGAYLRGAFLANGYISNPYGDFHFEITTTNEELAAGLVNLMNRYDINARCTQRHNTQVVYLKSAEHIISFLALVEAHKSALRFEDACVVKSVRNDTNRRVNAEMANQKKTSDAALKQARTIQQLFTLYDEKDIPESLKEIARLRIRHMDASVKELGELAEPPLSKSAVYHRLNRMEQMVAEIQTLSE